MTFAFPSNDDAPISLNFGPDGRIYTATFTDRTMFNTICNPDFTDDGFQIFLHADRSQIKGSSDIQPRLEPITHGKISDMVILGAGENRVIYTIDHSPRRHYSRAASCDIASQTALQCLGHLRPSCSSIRILNFDPPFAGAPFSLIADPDGNIYTTTTVGDLYGFRPGWNAIPSTVRGRALLGPAVIGFGCEPPQVRIDGQFDRRFGLHSQHG